MPAAEPLEEPSGFDPRTLWPSALLLLGLAAAALYQRRVEGLQIELIALGVLLVPALLTPVLAPRGLGPSLPWLLGLIALAGLEPRGVARWAIHLGALSAALAALSAGATCRGGTTLRWGSRALVLGALVDLIGLVVAGRLFARVRALAFVPVALAALRGQADPAASGRRAGLCLALLGLDALVWIRDWSGGVALLLTLVAGGREGWALLSERLGARRARRALFPLVAVGSVIAGLWLVGEVVMHLVPNDYANINVPEPNESFHEPGKTFTYRGSKLAPKVGFEVEVRWNQHGFWDVDHALQAAPGIARALVLGDSFVEGVQVELDDHLHRLLARGLTAQTGRTWEAISYGWSGFGQVASLEAFLEGGEAPVAGGTPYPPAVAYAPELVILEFLPGNDIYDNLPALSQLTLDQYWDTSFARRYYVVALEHGLYFTAMLLDKTDLFLRQVQGEQQSIVNDVYAETPPRYADMWAEAWERTEQALTGFAAACRERGIRLVVVIFPSLAEATQPGFDYPARRMLRMCADLGLECLDLTPRFGAHPDPAALFVKGDGHWGAQGHALASEGILDYLRAHPAGS